MLVKYFLILMMRVSWFARLYHRRQDLNAFKSNLLSEITDGGAPFDFKPSHEFLIWFVENGKFFTNSFKSIPLSLKPEEGQAGNCFHNSQRISIRYPKYGYWEGIIRGRNKKEAVHHGFNVYKNRVLDVSLLTNRSDFNESLKDQDFFYYGICIPETFYMQDKNIGNNRFYDNPLILKYFLSTRRN